MALNGIRTSGYRNYVNYDAVKQGNREKATTFHWELDFTTKPSGVYFPSDNLFHIRLTDCDPPEDPVPDMITTTVHGFELIQYGMVVHSGDFTGTLEDMIDQSFEYALRQMVYEADRPLDHTAKPKDELLWSGELIQFNNQDFPIKKWVIQDALITSFGGGAEGFNGQKDALGKLSITWKAQMAYVVQLNTSTLT